MQLLRRQHADDPERAPVDGAAPSWRHFFVIPSPPPLQLRLHPRLSNRQRCYRIPSTTNGPRHMPPATPARRLRSTRRQPQIPPGGLAYSLQGSYLCVFFGQTPAWPVDYFGQIDEGWDVLRNASWQSLSVERAAEEN